MMDTKKIKIGALIKEIIKRKGVTAAWLADAIGYVKSNITNIYERESINTDLLVKICIALEFDFFFLYSEYIRDICFLNPLQTIRFTGKKIHIGQMIKEELDKEKWKGRLSHLANKIACDKSIFSKMDTRENMSTDLLTRVCIHTEINYYFAYSEYVREEIRKKRSNIVAFS